MTGRFAHDAEFLRQQEFARLSAATVPTLESLRFLNPQQLRGCVTDMLVRLRYEVLTPETATDLLVIKDGKKYVVAFASTVDQLPTQANHLTGLHKAIIATNAAGGFYVTTRGFSRDAETYAKTVTITTVNGPQLVASIKRSMEGMPTPDGYKAMCRQCGEIVTHRLDRQAEAIPCSSGHPVAPTIPRAALDVGARPGGSTSRTYEPPRTYTRREVNAHNAKYAARKKKERKPVGPKEPALDCDAGPDPFRAE
jgi:hypothetical protein